MVAREVTTLMAAESCVRMFRFDWQRASDDVPVESTYLMACGVVALSRALAATIDALDEANDDRAYDTVLDQARAALASIGDPNVYVPDRDSEVEL